MKHLNLLLILLAAWSCKSLRRSELAANPGGVVIDRTGTVNCEKKKKMIAEESKKGSLKGVVEKVRLVGRAFDIAHASILAAVEYERLSGKPISCRAVYEMVGGRKLLQAFVRGEAISIEGRSIKVRATAVASTRQAVMKLIAAQPTSAAKLVDAALAEFQEQNSRRQGKASTGGMRDRLVVEAMSDALKILDGPIKSSPKAKVAAPHAAALAISLETLKVATGIGLENPTQIVRRVQQALANSQEAFSRGGNKMSAAHVAEISGAAVEFETTATRGWKARLMQAANPGQVASGVVNLNPGRGEAVLATTRAAANTVLFESAVANRNTPLIASSHRDLGKPLGIKAPPLPKGPNLAGNMEAFVTRAENSFRTPPTTTALRSPSATAKVGLGARRMVQARTGSSRRQIGGGAKSIVQQ